MKIKLFIIKLQKFFWLKIHHQRLRKAMLIYTIPFDDNKYNKNMKKYYKVIHKSNELYIKEAALK